ncbi:MAG: tRNA adenosine(34) deaminase TadA [Terriglobia bacterium]
MRVRAAVAVHPANDFRFMEIALREAVRAGDEGEVPVGAVVVHHRTVLARAHNRSIRLNDPTAHAEILALRRAAKKLGNHRLGAACSLYVTIEPCSMCAGAIIQARIGALIFGAEDFKAGAAGSALKVVNHPRLNHKVRITEGILGADCAAVLRDFFIQRRQEARC